jgi:predicted N-acyltransferase
MNREYRLYEKIDDVPLNEWNKVCQANSACFMDPGFLRAMERTLPTQARIFYVVIYEEDGMPGACASLCLYPIDLLLLASQRVRDRVRWLRKIFPRLGQTKILMCGLPFSAGQNNLVFAPGSNRARALGLLDALLQRLARREGARAIVFKEFGEEDRPDLDGLFHKGYWRADSLPMYELEKPFDSFAAYRAALKAHYRNDIRRSEKKFEKAGCRVVRLTEPGAIAQVYTPEVHALYEGVVGKSALKLEVLSRDFFLELARQMPGRLGLTLVYREDRIVACAWDLTDGREFHGLFLGLDYSQSREIDLYFNMVYQEMDVAFRSGAQIIHMGQTADQFKTLLGCSGKPRYIYARGVGMVLSWILQKCAGSLLPPRVPQPAHDVFKVEEQAPAPKVSRKRCCTVS